MAVVPNWLVEISTESIIAGSPEALFQELQHEKALVRAIVEANLKKVSPAKQP